MKMMQALLATTCLASTAMAEQAAKPVPAPAAVADPHEPTPGVADGRLRTWLFSTGMTLRITATGLSPVRLVFDAGELPVGIAGNLLMRDPAKAKDWYAVDSENTIILQPLHGNIPVSFAFITTAREGVATNYTLELRTREGDPGDFNDKLNYQQVTILHVPTPSPAAKDAAAVRLNAARAQQIGTRFSQARYGSGARNWHYEKRGTGCAKLVPKDRNWLSDDGHETTMLFPGHMRPSIIRSTEDPTDPALITPTIIAQRTGTLYVLPETYESFEIRRNLLVCEFRNDRFDDVGTTTGHGSGTISPDVLLRVRDPGVIKPHS